MKEIHVIGAGMAGVETAWMLARHEIPVILHEMKPKRFSPAHQSPGFAELVCSNSFGSLADHAAPTLLKQEMKDLGSLILQAADHAKVPAGKALGVDRHQFSQWITQVISDHPYIEIRRDECTKILMDQTTVIATGPMTSEALSENIAQLIGSETLYFYDSISPIIDATSIDMDKVYFASRYEDNKEDYLNCPMDQQQYEKFVQAINDAEKVPVRDFEEMKCFEGCQPIENLASRGVQTLAFGPMKPVGLRHPKTGKIPFAVVQLRKENEPTTMYNMVGFQTRMKWGPQKEIFRTIPGLEKAQFVRLGSMHRNTYINSPKLLDKELRLKTHPNIFFAGQLTGVEGYTESAAMGMMAGLTLASEIKNQEMDRPPATTAIGALMRVITTDPLKSTFSPMNIHYGLIPPLEGVKKMKKPQRRATLYQRARESFHAWRPQWIQKSN